jgi:uncharacterized cofD-like protein
MRVKRHLVVLALGITVTSLAMAMALANLYRNIAFPGYSTNIVRAITLQFIPHPMREMLVGVVGLGVIGFAVYYLSRSLFIPLIAGRRDSVVDQLYKYRFGNRGPKIVAIGGGTGLPTILRGLKERTGNLTAIVTMADDGGSTGRLRKEFGILPPGDFRNCIAALSDAEPLMQELFQYRFENDDSDLHGHSFGNLFITAMVGVTGEFESAVLESSRILAVRGTVLPSTLENVELHGITEDGTVLQGESEVGKAHGRIRKVFLQPEDPAGYLPAVQASLDADLIVFGPGSLYTSVIPPLLVGDIKQAIKNNPTALRVYICNVATQVGETDHLDALAHVRALQEQVGKRLFDYVIVNGNVAAVAQRIAEIRSQDPALIQPDWLVDAVTPDRLREEAAALGIRVIEADVISASNPLRHDPEKLAMALMRLHETRGDGRGERSITARASTEEAVATMAPMTK